MAVEIWFGAIGFGIWFGAFGFGIWFAASIGFWYLVWYIWLLIFG